MNAQRAFGGAAAAGCLYQQQQPASASEEGFNRFASLNVSRHPTTASLQNQTRRWETRPSLQPLEDPRSKPQPTLPARQRPHPALQEDVEGSHPMRLHYPRSGHKDWSDISDIPLTTSKAVAFGKGGRRVDPLEPRYALPSSPPPSIPEPAFKRDSHSVADIPGAQPRQKRTLKERGPPPVLEGQARRRSPVRSNPGPGWREMYDVADINYEGVGGMRRTQRSTDPQSPSYVIHRMVIADDPLKAHLAPPRKGRQGPPVDALESR